MNSFQKLLADVPSNRDEDLLLEKFMEYTASKKLELYESQEEAILELLSGNNVILNTPTGSGKSLVAAAGHFFSVAKNQRSFYTAPIKALVSEKFFSLREEFGSTVVGMITGDTQINPEAPIICCTAEILANQALSEGSAASVDLVIMDEFHYYGDPQRGWAWQVPLLELTNAQFLLMSATLGGTKFFKEDLTQRTNRETTIVTSVQRPVPLEFSYRKTTLHASIQELLEKKLAPIYLVHFTQREATEAAQNYLSLNPLSKAEKQEIKKWTANFRFDSPNGKDLKRYIHGGIGIHHAGLLPKYRLLVEKLAQEGLLKIICGTDTLGVGVNVPIKSVLFTKLCKYDGTKTRILSNREFHQIAGRAGRRGFDDKGFVWVQDPPHVIDNFLSQQKIAQDTKKKKRLVKKKPPERGYAHWSEDTYKKLISGNPEPLKSSFQVNHQFILQMLERPGDGCVDLKHILSNNHETFKRQRQHKKRAIAIYRSLQEADLLETLEHPDEFGRKVRIAHELQDEFALQQPLSLWGLTAIEQLDMQLPDYPLWVLSIIEATIEQPRPILIAQEDYEKQKVLAEMKARGVQYEERMEKLEKISYPKPNEEWIYTSFDLFRSQHPWASAHTVYPKGIVSDFYLEARGFNDFIFHYKLKRFEGIVLRYLSNVYKALVQTLPDTSTTEETDDLLVWMRAVIQQTDSSLLDEWENLDSSEPQTAIKVQETANQDIVANKKAFSVMVRNELFRWVQKLAYKQYHSLPSLPEEQTYDELMERYWEEYESIGIDANARSVQYFTYEEKNGEITQILVDELEHCSWRIQASVNFEQSRALQKPVVQIETVFSLEEG